MLAHSLCHPYVRFKQRHNDNLLSAQTATYHHASAPDVTEVKSYYLPKTGVCSPADTDPNKK